MATLIFDRIIAEKYLNISSKESFWEYYEYYKVIKYEELYVGLDYALHISDHLIIIKV